MRYLFVSAFFVITLSILVWITLDSNSINVQSSDEDCNKTNETIFKSHQEYLLQFDWHIQSKGKSCLKVINYYPEFISTLQSGGLNLEPYNNNGTEARVTTYTLKEKQQTGDKISVTIYEIDGKLVGGYGVLENWVPGIFSLKEKERLIEDGVVP